MGASPGAAAAPPLVAWPGGVKRQCGGRRNRWLDALRGNPVGWAARHSGSSERPTHVDTVRLAWAPTTNWLTSRWSRRAYCPCYPVAATRGSARTLSGQEKNEKQI
jgi:hypothetical protein